METREHSGVRGFHRKFAIFASFWLTTLLLSVSLALAVVITFVNFCRVYCSVMHVYSYTYVKMEIGGEKEVALFFRHAVNS